MDFGIMDFYDMNSPSRHPKKGKRPVEQGSCCTSCFVKIFIRSKCTENYMFALNCVIGFLVIAMQAVPFGMQNWIYVTEPRPLAIIDDQDNPLEAPFLYTTGYLIVCRELKNASYLDIAKPNNPLDFDRLCTWNPAFTGEDLTDFSFATAAILLRLGVPTMLHLLGTVLCVLAYIFAILGFISKNGRSIVSAICYVVGALLVSMAVLQFVCVVDDEMQPRMKPDAAGEPSSFSYIYGYSFVAAALSFLPAQFCVYIQTQVYFKRFPSPEEKSRAIPGLQQLLTQAKKRERFSFRPHTATEVNTLSPVPPENCYLNMSRRDTRTSRDFTAYSVQWEIPRLPSPLVTPRAFGERNLFRY